MHSVISPSSSPSYKIGVDGGGTKTELILVNATGEIVARHLAPGTNPSIAGPQRAREILEEALRSLVTGHCSLVISSTLLCMAGSPAFWQETAALLAETFHSSPVTPHSSLRLGTVSATDDSLPVLELATDGRPGLVLHGGTGSFIAARDPSRKTHYAGGLGWRFGDEGSGHELGRLAIARALLELQGWAPRSGLSKIVAAHSGQSDAPAITRWFYQHAEPNRQIASLAPAILDLAEHGDEHAEQIVRDACLPLLRLAERVAARLFPVTSLAQLPAGLSGPILTHSFVYSFLRARTVLPLAPVTESPIEGVRRLLLRA